MVQKATKWFGMTLLLGMAILSGCGKDDPERIAEKDREKILEYIRENDLDAREHESGIFYVVIREGSGGYPTENSWVNIHYVGYFLDGKVFDERYNYTGYISGNILGWRIGIPLFQKGGKGMLLIPSGLAYGTYGTFGVPPNSILIFDVELVDFN